MFVPGFPREPLDPDDCPTCEGAGGFYVQSGCFGREGRRCKDCFGKGKVTPVFAAIIKARPLMDQAHELDKKIASAAREVIPLEVTGIDWKAQYAKLEVLCREYKDLEREMAQYLKDNNIE